MSNPAGEPVPGAGAPETSTPPPIPNPERRGPNPPRALRIRNEFPSAIYDAIQSQYGRRDSIGGAVGFLGERIGFVHVDNPANPLRGVESRIHGNLMFTQWEDIPESPGHRRGVGEQRREFDIDTHFILPNHTYLDEERTAQLISGLESFGYGSQLRERDNGYRSLVIQTPEGTFNLNIGWSNAHRPVQWYRQLEEEYKEKSPGYARHVQAEAGKILQGQDSSNIGLEITNSHPGMSPGGIPLESREQVLQYLERSRDLAEIVATSLINVLGNGKKFPELKMDWLPPSVIKEMDTLRSSEVTGKVEPTVAIETKIAEDFGLERLAGLSPATLADLRRIKDRLQDPRRAAFMKKHGFKQSNGAVFWGVPGTGKTLAGEALAEEASCERVVLKVDEYMTAYIHESAHRLGEKLREIKTTSANKEKPVIVQIDEADTILMPVNGGLVQSRDASEVRAVLLREFQEPSNVFYILTTNLDPRDPRQADPAIVRNQRLGYLVGFGLPTQEGRQEIFAKEAAKRTSEDLHWENIDYQSLGTLTENFSPSDIQEVITVAAGESYDPDTEVAFITQQQMETAINLVKSRKLMEEKIRKPQLGFATNSQAP